MPVMAAAAAIAAAAAAAAAQQRPVYMCQQQLQQRRQQQQRRQKQQWLPAGQQLVCCVSNETSMMYIPCENGMPDTINHEHHAAYAAACQVHGNVLYLLYLSCSFYSFSSLVAINRTVDICEDACCRCQQQYHCLPRPPLKTAVFILPPVFCLTK